MKIALAAALGLLVGGAVIAACNALNETPGPTAAVTPNPVQAPATVAPATSAPPPTPIASGQAVVYNGLQVAMDRYEFSEAYTTDYNTSREPPQDKKFLWVHVVLKNVGGQVRHVPDPEHYSVLYYTTELKASYGHRQDFPDYTALADVIYPDEDLGAWLRFETPAAAGFSELLFAFIPESSAVSFLSLNSPYPWADHPLYLWALTR